MGGYLDEQCLKCDISFVFSEQFSEIAIGLDLGLEGLRLGPL